MSNLYRLYNAEGLLLWVGVSGNMRSRLREHKATKAWADQIARVEVQSHPSRSIALEAEARAIVTEKPLHNVMGRMPILRDGRARPNATRLMVNAAEKKALVRASKKAGVPLSTYVREAALEKARRG